MARSYSNIAEAIAKAYEPEVKKPKVKKEKGWKPYVLKSLKPKREENYIQAGAVYEFIKDKAPSIINKTKILKYYKTAELAEKLYDHMVWIEKNKESIDKQLGDDMNRTWQTKPYKELVDRIKILDKIKDIMEEPNDNKRITLLADKLYKLDEPNLYTYLYDVASDKTIYRENVENLISRRQEMNEGIMSYIKRINPNSIKDEQKFLKSWWRAARKILEETSKLNYESGTILKGLFEFNIWNLDFSNPENDEVQAFIKKINNLADDMTQKETTLKSGFATAEEMHSYEDIQKQMKRSRERERQERLRNEYILSQNDINAELIDLTRELGTPRLTQERYSEIMNRINELTIMAQEYTGGLGL